MLLNQQYTSVQEIFDSPQSSSTSSSDTDLEPAVSTSTPRVLTRVNLLASSLVMGVDLYADALQLLLLS